MLLFVLYSALNIIVNAGNLPKVFLLGTMKSGSSSLYEFLIRHPNICPGIRKEINFIQDDTYFGHKRQHHVHHGVRSRYEGHFIDSRCGNNDLFIDGSPQFHLMSKIKTRFKEIFTVNELSKLKFIVVLREPVARAISYYNMFTMVTLADGKPFDQIQTMKERDAHFAPNFNDAESLKIFLQVFRRDQLLIFGADDLFHKPTETMSVIASFLNIPFPRIWKGPFPHDDHLDHPRYRNILKCCEDYVPDLDCSFLDTLISRFKPMNDNIYSLLNQTRHQSFILEPTFPLYNETNTRAIPCVANAREKFNILRASGEKTKCSK